MVQPSEVLYTDPMKTMKTYMNRFIIDEDDQVRNQAKTSKNLGGSSKIKFEIVDIINLSVTPYASVVDKIPEKPFQKNWRSSPHDDGKDLKSYAYAYSKSDLGNIFEKFFPLLGYAFDDGTIHATINSAFKKLNLKFMDTALFLFWLLGRGCWILR